MTICFLSLMTIPDVSLITAGRTASALSAWQQPLLEAIGDGCVILAPIGVVADGEAGQIFRQGRQHFRAFRGDELVGLQIARTVCDDARIGRLAFRLYAEFDEVARLLELRRSERD